MGYSTNSTPFDRASTDSVRFSERVRASLLGVAWRAVAGWAVEHWRALAPATRADAAAGVQTQRERNALPAHAGAAAAGLAAAERQRELILEAGDQSSGALIAERRRNLAPASRAVAHGAAVLARQNYVLVTAADREVTSAGDTIVTHEL